MLAIVLALLTLSSCSAFEKITAYSLYSNAVETFDEAGGYEADCEMIITVDILGEDFEIPTNVNVKLNGDAIQMAVELDDSVMYTTVIDDTVYVDYDDVKIRYSLASDSSVVDELVEKIGAYRLPDDLSADLFENIEIVENDDETKKIVLSLDREDLTSLLNGADVDELGELAYENIVFTMCFDAENEFTGMHVYADCFMELLGYEVTGSVEATYTFVNFGEAPEIVLPSAYSEYTDGGEYTIE